MFKKRLETETSSNPRWRQSRDHSGHPLDQADSEEGKMLESNSIVTSPSPRQKATACWTSTRISPHFRSNQITNTSAVAVENAKRR